MAKIECNTCDMLKVKNWNEYPQIMQYVFDFCARNQFELNQHPAIQK